MRLWGVGGTESLGEVVIFKRVEDSSMPCQDLPASPTMQSLRRVRFSPFLITSLPSQKDLASSAFIPYKACEKVPLKEEIWLFLQLFTNAGREEEYATHTAFLSSQLWANCFQNAVSEMTRMGIFFPQKLALCRIVFFSIGGRPNSPLYLKLRRTRNLSTDLSDFLTFWLNKPIDKVGTSQSKPHMLSNRHWVTRKTKQANQKSRNL